MGDNVLIFGAGNLGIACAYKYLDKYYDVILYTGRVQGDTRISMTEINGDGESIAVETSQDPEIIKNADLILICGPGFMYDKWLGLIEESGNKDALICSVIGSNGFLESCMKHHIEQSRLAVFQRVPYICRSHYNKEINEYECTISGHKELHKIFLGEDFKISQLTPIIEDSKIKLLESPMAVSLSNSNPLLHTARLMSIGMKVYQEKVKFYEEWNDTATHWYTAMDEELMKLRDKVGVHPEDLPSVFEYYGVKYRQDLTDKIRSIEAFKGIEAPMIEVDGGYILDVDSRYFREDFVICLENIVDKCELMGVQCPSMRKVLEWGLIQICNKYYGV